MRVATFNLFQFLEPPNHWYERKDNGKSTYSETEWADKRKWIKAQLERMDADIVGFQEIFSEDALRTLLAEAGYPNFKVVGAPIPDEDDPEVFFNPVVGIATRAEYNLTSFEEVTVDDDLRDFLPVQDDFKFSRTPIRAEVSSPDFGDMVVYVCHLKSKRPEMDEIEYPDAMPWRERMFDTMQKLSRGHVSSMLRRGAEAAAIYLRVSDELFADEKKPMIVLGDLNDKLDSVALQSITMGGRIFEVGGVKKHQWPAEAKHARHRFKLNEAYNMLDTELDAERPGTHYFDKHWSTLDYVLLSDVFSRFSRNCIGTVEEVDVLNDHIVADGVGNQRQSDHGQVVVQIAPKSS